MKKILAINLILIIVIAGLLFEKFRPKSSPEYTWKTVNQTVVISYADGKQVKVILEVPLDKKQITDSDMDEIAKKAYNDKEWEK